MNPYDTLLIELLNRLDKKADRLISLLEQMTKPGGQLPRRLPAPQRTAGV